MLDIKLIESDEIGTVGVGEATIPTLVTFHRLLDINEQEFMAATQAHVQARHRLRELARRRRGLHPLLRHHRQGSLDGGLPALLAQGPRAQARRRLRRLLPGAARPRSENRFAHLPRGGMNYAFHIDASLYAKFLRKFSEGFGVQRIEGKIVEVKTDPAAGYITALRLDRARTSRATCSSTAPASAAC